MKAEEIANLIEFVNKYNISELRVESERDTLFIKNDNARLYKKEGKSTKNIESEKFQIERGKEKVITSPLVGVFYSSSSPEENAYVKIGDYIKKGQTVAIIEAMKLMNEIDSDCEGIVREILVNNGQMVEYNQPLFLIEFEE